MPDITELIKKAKIYLPSGASFTGDLSERIRGLFALINKDLSQVISTQVGDYVRTATKDDVGISLAAPIGYDVWYLFHTKSILPFETGGDNARTTQILKRLAPFLSKLQNIRPLRTLRDPDEIGRVLDVYLMKWSFVNSGPYMVKEMRYETILNGKSFKYFSQGMSSRSVGYLAFPIGQLGVMEIVSLIGESVTEDDGFSIGSQEAIVAGNEMMAPAHSNRGHCVGTHLIKGGYLVQDNVELMADDFKGQESVKPHRWLRYWLKPEDTFPVPGEFVCLLAKSELFHVYWFQETYPFIYSGNFFETEYYTSGIIKEIIEPDDESEEKTNIYKVWIRCYEMYLRPSDFYEYEVDERVAVVKETLALIDNWDWTLLESDKDNDSSSASSPDKDWRIVPISFYEGV